MNFPVVLVVHDSGPSAEDVINNIRKLPLEENSFILDEDTNTKGFRHHLVTKYYETDLLFVPVQAPLESCPQNLLNGVEGVLICFDAKKRDFLKVIPKYANFLKSRQIELGILLCDQLSEEEAEGITYREAKQCSKVLDVIELAREDVEEEEDPHNPTGYEELQQALRSFLWSSAEVSNAYHRSHGYSTMDAHDDDEDDQEVPTHPQMNEEEISAELANYDRLLSEVIQFRSATSSWTRNERLASLASLFDELLGIDSASEDDDHYAEEHVIPVEEPTPEK
uniref:Alpha-and gamma-adaptin-binding protein p34 n=1 Tax=Phlebotomus kandelakii TaxID=1109342 RepID=A0A6B2EAK8_9DIPT